MKLAIYEGGVPEHLSPLYIDTVLSMLKKISTSKTEYDQERLSIKGGNHLLTNTLAKKMSHRVYLGHPLTQVAKNMDGSLQLSFENGEKRKADILVLAIPCSVYQSIIFNDDIISAERLRSIHEINYGKQGKIVIPFASSPLKVLGLISEKLYSSFNADRRILTIHYLDHGFLPAHALAIQRYQSAKGMVEVEYTTASPIFKDLQEADDHIFAYEPAPLFYSWSQQPFSKGSYASIAPGQEELWNQTMEEDGERFKKLFEPIRNKIYFAGEHTALPEILPGTMEAACESGERVARVMINKLKTTR
ncbi:MAG: flavin monoamine oxidase family protein [Parachlamydiaceae bacterium]